MYNSKRRKVDVSIDKMKGWLEELRKTRSRFDVARVILGRTFTFCRTVRVLYLIMLKHFINHTTILTVVFFCEFMNFFVAFNVFLSTIIVCQTFSLYRAILLLFDNCVLFLYIIKSSQVRGQNIFIEFRLQ